MGIVVVSTADVYTRANRHESEAPMTESPQPDPQPSEPTPNEPEPTPNEPEPTPSEGGTTEASSGYDVDKQQSYAEDQERLAAEHAD